MKEVVINRCYGGFDLSLDAEVEYLKKKNPDKKITVKKDEYGNKRPYINGEHHFLDVMDKNLREDPLLIEVIKKLGDKAEGEYSKLKIVEIPEDVEYYIDEYDGVETIHEAHRSWC